MRSYGSGTDISTLYRDLTGALTEVLAENAVGPARRGRLARARTAVKKHPDYSEHEYFLAVEAAFKNWEAMQNVGARIGPLQVGQYSRRQRENRLLSSALMAGRAPAPTASSKNRRRENLI